MALFASFHVLFVGSTTHAGSIALLPLTTTGGLLLLTVFIVGVLVALLACLHVLFVATTLIVFFSFTIHEATTASPA